ncbi:hypothetical protein M408DRAFT_333832 [Serendipita vermifera MAFF 305830]|uniref:Uncharacterized protein n=1 Tax=Serendipita vermifera MAFF 305830 TaxID=933852 RepID=A0A0C2W2M5_SERVB|nr:hypothetical protein M408DRAFT_333832 [Serendipita vermifera MAFF 305830]
MNSNICEKNCSFTGRLSLTQVDSRRRISMQFTGHKTLSATPPLRQSSEQHTNSRDV